MINYAIKDNKFSYQYFLKQISYYLLENILVWKLL
jgi:hypothetical protein